MSSSGPVQHYFSTHNALCVGDDEDEKILVHIVKLGEDAKRLSLLVYPFNNVEMIKRLIMKKFQLPKSTKVSDICVFRRGLELRNHQSLNPFLSDINNAVVRLQWGFKDTTPGIGLRPIGLRPPPFLHEAINEISLALQRGVAPKLTLEGTGGTYFLFNTKRKSIAMFKPRDEEAFAPNNPRGYEGHFGQKGFRQGVASGEGALREVAAFLLDAQHGSVAGVPETTQVEACHPAFCYRHTEHLVQSSFLNKGAYTSGAGVSGNETLSLDAMPWKEGSLQEYLDAKDTCGDFDPNLFSIAETHYIGILDIRLLNLDRNDGNILVTQRQRDHRNSADAEHHLTPEGKISKYTLIPIDHGLILPTCMDVGDIDLAWYYWPQSKIPFSETVLHHIFLLNADRDAARLMRKLDIQEDCLRTMRVATRVLQVGSRMHLNLYQIAGLVVRKDDFEKPSIMECAVKEALMQAYTAISASCLTQPGRLLGNVLFDLHHTEAKHQLTTTTNHPLPSEKGCQVQGCPDGCSQHKVAGNPVVHSHNNKENMESAMRPCNGKIKNTDAIQTIEEECPHATVHTDRFNRHASELIDYCICNDSCSASDTSHLTSNGSQSIFSPHHEGVQHQESHESHRRCSMCNNSSHKSILASLQLNEVNSTRGNAGHSQSECASSNHQKSRCCCQSVDFVATTNSTMRCSNRKSTVHLDAAVQRVTTTTRRRSTAYRSQRPNGLQVKSSWTLRDSNKKIIYLDWNNSLLEKRFFDCFELLIKHYITKIYPEWSTFPFNGHNLLQELECSQNSSTHKRRVQRLRSNNSPQGISLYRHTHTKYGTESHQENNALFSTNGVLFKNLRERSTVTSAY